MAPTQYVSQQQLELLVTFMENTQNIGNSRKFLGGHMRLIADKAWDNCARKLNTVGNGITKSGQHWKRYWHVFKSRTKSKALEIQKQLESGGVSRFAPLTEVEERVLALLHSQRKAHLLPMATVIGSKSAESLLVRKSAESLPVRKSAESLPVRKSAESLLVRKSAESLPVRKSAESLPVRKSAERLLVRKSAESLPVRKSAESLPVRIPLNLNDEDNQQLQLEVLVEEEEEQEISFIVPKHEIEHVQESSADAAAATPWNTREVAESSPASAEPASPLRTERNQANHDDNSRWDMMERRMKVDEKIAGALSGIDHSLRHMGVTQDRMADALEKTSSLLLQLLQRLPPPS